MINHNIVEQEYWDRSYDGYKFAIAGKNDPLRNWITQYIPTTNNSLSCLEIGCFPGRYLAVLGELGYELHGIDLTPRIEEELKEWLKASGYKTGNFSRKGVEQLDKSQQYHIVCSFGFIEHFKDWENVFLKHLDLVSDNGYILITTPNFRGLVQQIFHRIVDKENFQRHVLSAMNPSRWKELAASKNFEIIFSGFFGEYDFWVGEERRSLLQQKLLQKINNLTPILKKLPKNNLLYSPYCGIVAKKLPK